MTTTFPPAHRIRHCQRHAAWLAYCEDCAAWHKSRRAR